MKCLIQRVTRAEVDVAGRQVGRIDRGLLVFAGLEKNDASAQLTRMVERLLSYRVFPDGEGRMNRNVVEAEGALLVVSQFTLAADTRKGTRPSFSSALPPAEAKRLFDEFLEGLRATGIQVETGEFGADMAVSLVNDGPVTFLLET